MITIGDKTIEVSETAGTSIGSEETPVLVTYTANIDTRFLQFTAEYSASAHWYVSIDNTGALMFIAAEE